MELKINNFDEVKKVTGNLDKNLKLISKALDVNIKIKDDVFDITGDNEELAYRVLSTLIKMADDKEDFETTDIEYIIELAKNHREEEALNLKSKPVAYTVDGRALFPKSLGQKKYIESIMKNDMVFGTGPAGTGKTYLAVALAASSLKNKQCDRIILTRPAVEAGESLGFLPGDLKEKVDPYLRPIYDALFEILGPENSTRFLEKGIIEIAPLAYMRGRTLDNAFIVLDEAQNTTPEQMKMFLTRLGFSSKMVITGDITQTDLHKKQISGLLHAKSILSNTRGIDFIDLKKVDIVRHPLVRKVIDAYEKSIGD